MKVNILIIKSSKCGTHIGNSSPCCECKKLLDNFSIYGYKIKNIFFSNNNNTITKIKLNHYKNNYYNTKFYIKSKKYDKKKL